MVEGLSPGRKAQHTAKWARTMTKWFVAYSRRKGVRWNLVDFEGQSKSESRGIVDLVAIRKNHQQADRGLLRGDLFEIVLIQVKGGAGRRPTGDDIARLKKVARHHKAKAIVLAEWRIGNGIRFSRLSGTRWIVASPDEVFG